MSKPNSCGVRWVPSRCCKRSRPRTRHSYSGALEERPRLTVDEAHSGFNHAKVEGLIRHAGLCYPDADLRRLNLVDERAWTAT